MYVYRWAFFSHFTCARGKGKRSFRKTGSVELISELSTRSASTIFKHRCVSVHVFLFITTTEEALALAMSYLVVLLNILSMTIIIYTENAKKFKGK